MAIRVRVAWVSVRVVAALAFAVLSSAVASAGGGLAASPLENGPLGTFGQPLLCRFGVAATDTAQRNWLPTWRAGWTLDFSAHLPPALPGEFVQVIRVSQRKEGCVYFDSYTTAPALTENGVGAIIRAAPGSLWIVGNEPDRGPNPESCAVGVQDDMFPELYARVYHDAYTFIKQRDPAARVSVAGLVQVTPGRLQYLDKVWREYQRRYGGPMPVDVWNMHLYILPEALPDGRPNGIASIALGTDPALAIRESGGDPRRCSDPQVYCYAEHDDLEIFAQQIVAMRTWMKQHGQQDKPLILSEYSLLYPYEVDPEGCFLQDEYGNCFTPQRVNTFMSRTFSYLETAADPNLGYPRDGNRLVQQWLWFSAYNRGTGNVSNLLVNTLDALTPVGERFRDEVGARPSTVNLLPGTVGGIPGRAASPGDTARVGLYAQVFNNGSIAVATPFTVTFYADSALSHVVGSAVVPALPGCAVQSYTVITTWDGLAAGIHRFWVSVDSDNSVGETDETDNIAAGTVAVYGDSVYLPVVMR